MAAARKLILVVDDDQDVADLMAKAIQLKGYATLNASDGLEAIVKAFLYRPALIFMDIRMPRMDGYEATRRILADPEMCRIPVVAISAYCHGDWADQAKQAGCVECLPKPVDFEVVGEVLARLVGDC